VFAVGHFAAGYLTSRTVGKVLKVSPNPSLLLLAFVIQYIDILIPRLEYRGSTPAHHYSSCYPPPWEKAVSQL